jgi:hypothetical protein
MKAGTVERHLAPLTEAEWLARITKHSNTFVLIEGGRVVNEGPHLLIAGAFTQSVAEGRTASVMSRYDWLKVRTVDSVMPRAASREGVQP